MPALTTIGAAVANATTRDDAPVDAISIIGLRPALEFRLAPIAMPFLNRHLAMRMEIVADDGFVDVVAGGFDAGVRYGEAIHAT